MTTTDTEYLGLREPRERANSAAIREMVEHAIRDGAAHWQRLQEAQAVLFCEYEGRDGTGTKGVDDNGRLRGPFPGSADTDVALAAEVLQEKTDMMRMALALGSLNALPMDGLSDTRSAAYAAMELHYYLNGPMEREITSVTAQAAKWHLGFGSYVMALDWKRRTHARERVISLEQVYAWAVEQGTQDFMTPLAPLLEQAGGVGALDPQEAEQIAVEAEAAGAEAGAEVLASVGLRARLEELVEVLNYYAPDLCAGEAQRAARAFQRGQTEVTVCAYEVVEDRPQVRGLRPGVDILMPADTVCAAEAEWTLEPRWMSLRAAKALAVQEGWDAEWTEKLMETRGAPFGLYSQYGLTYPWLLSRTSLGTAIPWDVREQQMVCPMLFTYRATSQAGVEAIYQCLVHDSIEGFGFHEMLETLDGLMPYEDFRSDASERLIFECPGVVQQVAALQAQVKGNMDATFDTMSLMVNPPLRKPSRLSASSIRSLLGPGSEFHVERTDDPRAWEFMNVNTQNGVGMGPQMDAMLRKLVARQFALRHPELPPELAQARWQVETDDFLRSLSRVLRRVYAMIQAYGPEQVRLRVTEQPGILAATGGASASPPEEAVRRDEIRGSYDFTISFDTRNLVMEWNEQRGKQFAAMLSIDTMGAVPRVPILRAFAAMIDPKLAGLIRGEEEAAQGQLARTMNDINSIVAGQEPPVVPGQNHKLALQYTQQILQASPRLQSFLQDEQVRAVMENWLKQHEMQVKQEQNKLVGRTGGRPVLSGGIAGNGQ